MKNRSFPSYWVYRDVRNDWRCAYDLSDGRTIAVSIEAYATREDCENSIKVVQPSGASLVWPPKEHSNAFSSYLK
jgi:uncharacterized protein